MRKKKTAIKNHILIPEHIKLSESEKKELLEKYHISVNELPKINSNDPAILDMKTKAGDIIKIIRKSSTAGESAYYRAVIN